MKVVSVIGGRPNLIKLAAISPFLEKRFKHLILHSGQHYNYNLSQSFFEELNIPAPNENLNVGPGSQAKQTAKIMVGCEKYFLKSKINIVIVYGDMNSTLGASLAAAKLNIPIVHIEAGIRSFDNTIPEEINRKIVDHISTILFAPTQTANENLEWEGLKDKTIISGDTTYDTFLKIEKKLSSDYYKNLNLKKSAYFVATIHRPSNTDSREKLKFILTEFINLKKPIIFLLHPRTKKMLIKFNLYKETKNTNIFIKPPSKYIESLSLQKYAKAVLTDSGGIQKEAYFLRVPCFTFRDSTEWPDTVSIGWNVLFYNQKKSLVSLVKNYKVPKNHPDIFGNGHSANKIVKVIEKYLNN